MSAESPMATLTKWIVNYEKHEKSLLDRISIVEGEMAVQHQKLNDLNDMLSATRRWLGKFRELLTALETTNQASVDLLDQEQDDTFASELGTHFDRIKWFLAKKANEPQTIAEIEEGTRIPRTSISAVMYRTHNDKFVSRSISGKRGKSWALTTDEFAKPCDEPETPLPPMPPPDSSAKERPAEEDIPF
jgi:uncharacterized coiled-coil protein SlyX